MGPHSRKLTSSVCKEPPLVRRDSLRSAVAYVVADADARFAVTVLVEAPLSAIRIDEVRELSEPLPLLRVVAAGGERFRPRPATRRFQLDEANELPVEGYAKVGPAVNVVDANLGAVVQVSPHDVGKPLQQLADRRLQLIFRLRIDPLTKVRGDGIRVCSDICPEASLVAVPYCHVPNSRTTSATRSTGTPLRVTARPTSSRNTHDTCPAVVFLSRLIAWMMASGATPA